METQKSFLRVLSWTITILFIAMLVAMLGAWLVGNEQVYHILRFIIQLGAGIFLLCSGLFIRSPFIKAFQGDIPLGHRGPYSNGRRYLYIICGLTLIVTDVMLTFDHNL